MYRVELKATSFWEGTWYFHWFLMYRVELKDLFHNGTLDIRITVPNVPCGVESAFMGCLCV